MDSAVDMRRSLYTFSSIGINSHVNHVTICHNATAIRRLLYINPLRLHSCHSKYPNCQIHALSFRHIIAFYDMNNAAIIYSAVQFFSQRLHFSVYLPFSPLPSSMRISMTIHIFFVVVFRIEYAEYALLLLDVEQANVNNWKWNAHRSQPLRQFIKCFCEKILNVRLSYSCAVRYAIRNSLKEKKSTTNFVWNSSLSFMR